MNNKKITIMFILVSFAILVGIGITFAYFTSSTDFENEFTTGLFQTEATETFTSPQNWLPGDTTPKELTITNTGNVDVKARVCIEENWESANGDTLDNEVNGERVAILNLANTSDWTYTLGCYYYNDTLEPNDETTSFIESVTFNPMIEADTICTTSGNTKTCTSSGDGYDNATYTLTFTVETIQANAYDKLWFIQKYSVYNYHTDEIELMQEVPNGIVLYDTFDEAKQHFSNSAYALKHIINNNVVIENYIELNITDDLALTYPGLNVGTYTFRGAGSTCPNNNPTDCYDDSPYYEDNLSTGISAFGSSNCSASGCSISSFYLHISLSGNVSVGDYDKATGCQIRPNGNSSCYFND